jgi:cellulose biosynthesis protein BcsQ
MRIIAFFSQKGGCGKTTACVNLAGVLAAFGRRVLLVDLDSNSCASRTFDVVDAFENSIAAALLGARPLADVIHPTHLAGLSLAPGVPELHSLEKSEPTDPARRAEGALTLSETALALELERLSRDAFDYILLDCAGGHPFMEHLALLAADEVIVPTGLSVYDLYAATPTLQLVLEARQVRGADRPLFLGFLPNGAGKAGVPAAVQATLERYSLPCFTPIRHSALLKTIPGRAKPEQRLAALARPDSPAGVSFRQVAREIELGLAGARAAEAKTP